MPLNELKSFVMTFSYGLMAVRGAAALLAVSVEAAVVVSPPGMGIGICCAPAVTARATKPAIIPITFLLNNIYFSLNFMLVCITFFQPAEQVHSF
jgi:hypothetical protein